MIIYKQNIDNAYRCLDNNLSEQFVSNRQQYLRMNKKVDEQIQKEIIGITLRKMQKFYLVGITGRTSFILENIKGVKFKITIGNQLKCSCRPHHSQHCQHTLYCLSEIFYIPIDHHLMFKNTYNDIQLRYIIANRRIHNNKIAQFLKYVKNRPVKNVIREENQEDQDQNICAICHMEIVKNDATTTCHTVCRNTFHLDCFSQWVKHQLKNNGLVTCPLCRDLKNSQILIQLHQKEIEHKQSINNKKIGLEYHYYCDGCQLKEIETTQIVYKCVQCEDMTLCESCFKGGRHIRHSFICKKVCDKKWKECEDRKGKKKYDSQQGLIRMKLPNIKKFSNFLASALPCYFSKNTRWNIVECKKLQIRIEDLECIACSDKQRAFLRRMHCNHFIHHKCLRRRIQSGKLYCKIDGQKYLHGYDSLKKLEQLNKKVEGEEGQQEEQEKYQVNRSSLEKSIRLGKSVSMLWKDTILNNRSLNEGRNQSMSRQRSNPQ